MAMSSCLILSARSTGTGSGSNDNRVSSPIVSFKNQVQPIFDYNCVACHQAGSAQEGLILEEGKSYANIVGKNSHESDKLLVSPGSADSSYLIKKIEGTHLAVNGRGARMPLGGSLEEAEIATVRKWVETGAINN